MRCIILAAILALISWEKVASAPFSAREGDDTPTHFFFSPKRGWIKSGGFTENRPGKTGMLTIPLIQNQDNSYAVAAHVVVGGAEPTVSSVFNASTLFGIESLIQGHPWQVDRPHTKIVRGVMDWFKRWEVSASWVAYVRPFWFRIVKGRSVGAAPKGIICIPLTNFCLAFRYAHEQAKIVKRFPVLEDMVQNRGFEVIKLLTRALSKTCVLP